MSDSNAKFSFPQTNVVVKEDNDVVIEMTRNGSAAGEINFSLFIRTFLQAFGISPLRSSGSTTK